MTNGSPDILVCGAGMVGIAAAYHLCVRHNVKNLVIVDERQPLTLTSDKGTEAYRNWWPGPDDTMVRFMNRSIDLLEELARASDNHFRLSRRGYLFLTADAACLETMRASAQEISQLGAGALREHRGENSYTPSPPEGFEGIPDGADLLLDGNIVRNHFPFVTADVIGGMHVRRAGWLNARKLGWWMLDEIQAHGGQLRQDGVESITVTNNRVTEVGLRSGRRLSPGALVVAVGPYLKPVAALMDIDLPVVNELHGKIALRDPLGIVPNDAPLMIWNDPLYLPWTDAERAQLRGSDARLLEQFPAGVHFRPRVRDGEMRIVIIWTYEARTQTDVTPPDFGPHFPEILLRGLARMVPGLSAYFGKGAEATVDGGYYCKTRENRPLIGPLPVDGAYVAGALSGFGVMGAQAAGELVAAHVTGATLPAYAPRFLLDRYNDPAYQALLAHFDSLTGQL